MKISKLRYTELYDTFFNFNSFLSLFDYTKTEEKNDLNDLIINYGYTLSSLENKFSNFSSLNLESYLNINHINWNIPSKKLI